MNIPAFNIKDTSSAALKRVVDAINVELHERDLVEIHSDAVTMSITVGEVESWRREAYVTYLENIREISPSAEEILSEWYSEEDRKQSMRTTGA